MNCFLFGCQKEYRGEPIASCPNCWRMQRDMKTGLFPVMGRILALIFLIPLAPVALICLCLQWLDQHILHPENFIKVKKNVIIK